MNKTGNAMSSRCESGATMLTMVIAVAMLLNGCVTVTDPVPVGKDTYMIGLGARGGFSSDAELLSQSIKAAGAFCASQHRGVEVQSTNASGVQGWTPQGNQVVFKCVSP